MPEQSDRELVEYYRVRVRELRSQRDKLVNVVDILLRNKFKPKDTPLSLNREG